MQWAYVIITSMILFAVIVWFSLVMSEASEEPKQ